MSDRFARGDPRHEILTEQTVTYHIALEGRFLLDVELEDAGAVHEPVDGRHGHATVGEDGLPLPERLIGGNDIPYGVYDLSRDEGWVSVGIDYDTAHFAVNGIRRWWNRMGRGAYGGTGHLVITADAGGSNSPRTRLWKWELQRFANRTGLTINDHGLPLSAGHQQVESQRAPTVLLHRHELAPQAAGQPGYRGQSDRRHDNTQRPAIALGDRYAIVPSSGAGDRRANAANQSVTA